MSDTRPAPPITLEGIEEQLLGDLARAERLAVRTRLAELRESERGLPAPYTRALAVPRHALTDFLPHLDRMAAQGMELIHIAARLGLSTRVLNDFAERFADVKLALTGGFARGIDEMSGALYRAGVAEGAVGAQTFYLRTKANYRDQKESGPAVVVNVGTAPAPITIEHAADLSERQRALLTAEEGD